MASPIPDDYEFNIIFPEPGSRWDGQRSIKMCSRIGSFVARDYREGYVLSEITSR
jgi:hypothetical protein